MPVACRLYAIVPLLYGGFCIWALPALYPGCIGELYNTLLYGPGTRGFGYGLVWELGVRLPHTVVTTDKEFWDCGPEDHCCNISG